MYGGYGNLWSQGGQQGQSAQQQWQATGNAQNQNQQQMTQSFAPQQQSMMSFGGNMASAAGFSGNAAGMMGYMNMGMAGSQFMNYGGNAGYMAQANAAWLGNQQYQLQQQGYQATLNNFPGGRPPLPPGPPPPDKQPNTEGNQQRNQPALPPLPSNSISQQQPPPPPPPPQKQAVAPGMVANTISPGSLKPEDALNIIKSAAALGMLPCNGPLASLPLNVSAELFGSKNSQGIPGLDMVDDQDHRKQLSPEPELVDLENENNTKPTDMNLDSSNDSFSNSRVTNLKDMHNWTTASPKDSFISAKSGVNVNSVSQKNELVWELRQDAKSDTWRIDEDRKAKATTSKTPDTRWELGQQNPTQFNSPATSSKISDPGISSNEGSLSQEKFAKNVNENKDGKAVQIPLEPADGKDLVYDKRTLKQFDKKFREWEGQFERWMQGNENHPDRATYKRYLDQWNEWREQLIEQRRSILDKMTKARLDSKDIILAKIESLDDDMSSSGLSLAENLPQPQPLKNRIEHVQQTDFMNRSSERGSENPFEVALKTTEVRKVPPAAPTLIMAKQNDNDVSDDIPPLIPGLKGEKKALLSTPPAPLLTSSRPVERILRDNGRGRSEANIFENEFNQSRGPNPFLQDSNISSGDDGLLGLDGRTKSKPQPQRLSEDPKPENASLPFEWSLPNKSKPADNPFASNNNPFMQPSGPNPFEIKTEQKLPSLQDFIQRTSTSMVFPTSASQSNQTQSSNPFAMSMSGSAERLNPSNSFRMEQVERIPRDPQGNQSAAGPASTSHKSLRLEANPVGMPLLIAAKEDTPPPKNEMDEISHLFSRDRGPAAGEDTDAGNVQFDDDDDFCEAEVIDYGAANDDLDFPRGENPGDDQEENDIDFSLEDSEVIDYSQGVPSQQMGHFQAPGGAGPYNEQGFAGYPNEYDHGYPPYPYPISRGRGRGYPPGRGHPRGFPSGHPHMLGRGYAPHGFDPLYQEFPHPPSRGRPFNRGHMPSGRGAPVGGQHEQWYQHDDRSLQNPPIQGGGPEVIELSPSPEPPVPNHPQVKIAPPNPEFDRDRRRSRSRERVPRGRSPPERSRSRSRDRVRRSREEGSLDKRDRDRRRDESPYSVRRDGRDRERDRDRKPSPERRGRNDEIFVKRDRDRDRDRHYRDRRGRSRSKSKSPTSDRQVLYRNPLFPSASAGSLGSHPASNPPPPRYQTVLIEDILNNPGRSKRPSRLVIFMRGLPGAGKSHIVKLIKEREVQMGGKAPRILSLDNYFMTEMEKREKDPVTGLEFKKTVMQYDYDEEREPEYRAQLVKQFKKTLDEGYFSFVIVDCVNEFIKQFEEMTVLATQKRFQVYVAEIEETVDVCTKRNIHKRTKEQIAKINRNWERTPSHLIKLDTRTLLQDEAIQDVEMEDVSDIEIDGQTERTAPTPAERGKIGPQVLDLEDVEDDDSGDHLLASAQSSKWDTLEHTQEKLNKLDGLMKKRRTTNDEADSAPSIENWLSTNLPDDYGLRTEAQPGQKRVRWADIEERRKQERMRQMGFVVGHTDWKRMMDPTFGSSALTRTKFI